MNGLYPAGPSALVSVCEPCSGGGIGPGGSELLGRRLGRVAAGGVLLLGPVLLPLQFLVLFSAGTQRVLSIAPLLALLWLCAATVFFLARRFGRSNAALAFFDGDAFGRASFLVPALGVALVGPLSLHAVIGFPVWIVDVVTGSVYGTTIFNHYVSLALLGTSHVHLIFAAGLGWAALAAARGDAAVSMALWPSVVASLVPGLIVLFPPVLVWLTGYAVSKMFLKRADQWFNDDERCA